MIVGFSGRLQAGKDTAGYRLVDKYGFRRISFAEALKRDTAAKFRRTLKAHFRMIDARLKKLDDEGKVSEAAWDGKLHDALWINRDEVTRAMLQEVGTDVYRAIDPDWWIKRWHDEVTKVDNGHVVVTDVRFVNEAEAILSRSGVLIRIERPSLQAGSSDAQTHESENGLKGWTRWNETLVNDCTVEDLWTKIDKLTATWGVDPIQVRKTEKKA